VIQVLEATFMNGGLLIMGFVHKHIVMEEKNTCGQSPDFIVLDGLPQFFNEAGVICTGSFCLVSHIVNWQDSPGVTDII